MNKLKVLGFMNKLDKKKPDKKKKKGRPTCKKDIEEEERK